MISTTCFGQKRIKFNYDSSGNQVRRYICLNCIAARNSDLTYYKTQEELKENDLITDEQIEEVKYYPNPVLEELYIKWSVSKNTYVSNISVFSITGQLITQLNYNKNQDFATISFNNLPAGYYNVLLVYNNSNKKTLKILKK